MKKRILAALLLGACAGQGVRPAGPAQVVVEPGLTQEEAARLLGVCERTFRR